MSEPITRANKASKYWDGHLVRYRNTGAVYSETHLAPNHFLYNSSSMSGQTNPHWKQQVSKRLNATTPFTGSELRLYTKPYVLMYEQWSPTYDFGTAETKRHWYGYPYPYYQPTSYFAASDRDSALTKATNQAKTEFVNKARQFQAAAQGGMILGELRDTIRQIKRPANGLRTGVDRYLEHVKKRATYRSGKPKFDNLRNLSQMVSDTWLEYSLGWKPFAADIRGAVEHIAGLNEKDLFETKEVNGYGSADFAKVNKQSHQTTYLGPFKMDEQLVYRVEVKYAGAVGTRANAAGYVAQRIGLDPSDILPTVWELVPYSFIVDYFVNVGDLISAYSFNRSAVAWGWVGTRIRMKSDYVNWTHNPAWPAHRLYYKYPMWHHIYRRDLAWQPGAISSEMKTYTRSHMGSVIPTLEFSTPGSATRWLNIATLFNASRYTRKLLRG